MIRHPFDLAARFLGVKERAGKKDHPLVQWWLSLCGYGLDSADEIPWCSAFVNGVAWEWGDVPRSKSAAARSWLRVGQPVSILGAVRGYDVVVLQRGAGPQPGPNVLQAPGHVGWFDALDGDHVVVLGGNQSNEVNFQRFPVARVLGVRRLSEAA